MPVQSSTTVGLHFRPLDINIAPAEFQTLPREGRASPGEAVEGLLAHTGTIHVQNPDGTRGFGKFTYSIRVAQTYPKNVGSKQGVKIWNDTFSTSLHTRGVSKTARQYCSYSSEPQFDRWRDQIRSFANLPRDWDSYGAEAPSEISVVAALKILDNLELLGVEPEWITPTSDASLLMQFCVAETLFKWELEADGDIGVMIRPPEGKTEFVDVDLSAIDSFFDQRCHVGM
ncbi:MAG: hypothetical protein JJT96_15675 [Opitutales bacterium]|nr:hypothetical protein [Opitutales bacterium]